MRLRRVDLKIALACTAFYVTLRARISTVLMIDSLRLVCRLIAIFFVSLLLWLYAMAVRCFSRNDPHKRYRLICTGMSFYSRAVARIIGMRLRVEGTPPKAPFVLVANHISFTDILALCTVSPGCFVSKAEVAKWPGLGQLVGATNAIFLRRETREDIRRVNQMLDMLLGQGGGILFFPEGTTSDGTSVRPFKSSLFQPAIDAGVPVHCAAIAYTTPPGSPPPGELVALTGETRFDQHLKTLLSATGFTGHLCFSDRAFVADTRKQLAQDAHALVATLHREMTSGWGDFQKGRAEGEATAEGA